MEHLLRFVAAGVRVERDAMGAELLGKGIRRLLARNHGWLQYAGAFARNFLQSPVDTWHHLCEPLSTGFPRHPDGELVVVLCHKQAGENVQWRQAARRLVLFRARGLPNRPESRPYARRPNLKPIPHLPPLALPDLRLASAIVVAEVAQEEPSRISGRSRDGILSDPLLCGRAGETRYNRSSFASPRPFSFIL